MQARRARELHAAPGACLPFASERERWTDARLPAPLTLTCSALTARASRVGRRLGGRRSGSNPRDGRTRATTLPSLLGQAGQRRQRWQPLQRPSGSPRRSYQAGCFASSRAWCAHHTGTQRGAPRRQHTGGRQQGAAAAPSRTPGPHARWCRQTVAQTAWHPRCNSARRMGVELKELRTAGWKQTAW